MDNPMMAHIFLFPISCIIGGVFAIIYYRNNRETCRAKLLATILLFPFGYFSLQILLLSIFVPISSLFEKDWIIGISILLTALFAWHFSFRVMLLAQWVWKRFSNIPDSSSDAQQGIGGQRD